MYRPLPDQHFHLILPLPDRHQVGDCKPLLCPFERGFRLHGRGFSILGLLGAMAMDFVTENNDMEDWSYDGSHFA